MNDAFYQLENTKRQQIINAAIKEFTTNGYERASTNQIVKHAGIGKGTLFYYFNNKKDLFVFLVEYCLDIIREEFYSRVDMTEKDLIERWKMVSLIKMDFLKKHPDTMGFLTKAAIQEVEQLDATLRSEIKQVQKEGIDMLYQDINVDLFQKDLDRIRAMKIIQWVVAGYEEDLKRQMKQFDMKEPIDYQPFFDDFFAYLDVLKTAFYMNGED